MSHDSPTKGGESNGIIQDKKRTYGTTKASTSQSPQTSSSPVQNFFRGFSRKKQIDLSNVEFTELKRCLNTFDLTALGVGSTLGVGIYVLAGQVARQTAGPAIVISFAIAAFASVLAGLCYAEFGGRIPKTGSAYVYSYYTVGELWAFIIGWNLILEYTIGTASVARAWSGYFDSLIGNVITNFFQRTMPMELTGLSTYPDFFAFGITMVLAILLLFGVKESSTFNNIFTGVNLLVVSYVVICGLFKIDIYNWTIPAKDVPKSTNPLYENGDGGFMPFGFNGIVSGAATCFFGFVGFDVIATTGEETKNPQKAIPISIIISLVIVFIAYFGVSSVITLMVPYYTLDTSAPLPIVFDAVGYGVAKYVIAVGAVCALTTSLLGGMFPLPRVIYAMASDGLIFRFLASINPYTKTPVIATLLSGLFAASMALLFDLKELVDMMSIGVLLAYTLVAACVMMLRYRKLELPVLPADPLGEAPDRPSVDEALATLTQSPSMLTQEEQFTTGDKIRRVFHPLVVADAVSDKIVKLLTAILSLFIIVLTCLVALVPNPTIQILAVIPAVFIIFITILIWRQPQDLSFKSFKMPLVPFIPVLSMTVNIYLMFKLSKQTWIRFAVWMAIGFAIYFFYGMWHSSERLRKNLEPDLLAAQDEIHVLPIPEDVEANKEVENTTENLSGSS
ncbi:high affinity cationic amino acid transporter 1-like [Lineus longissimus]|uniref:high affinity cationic amino acid transporter 1-like n=1 Tax=Lineus longissimus TaxID=88925 RepID=UPI002B4DFA0A